MNHGVNDFVLFDVNATVTDMPPTTHFVPRFTSYHTKAVIWDRPEHGLGSSHHKGITGIRRAKL